MLGSDYMLMTGFDFFLPNTHYRQLSWNCAPSSALNLIHLLERVVWQINFLKVQVSDIYFMWEEKWVTTHVERNVVCHKFSYNLLLSNFLGFSINCMISDPSPPSLPISLLCPLYSASLKLEIKTWSFEKKNTGCLVCLVRVMTWVNLWGFVKCHPGSFWCEQWCN